MTSNAGGTCPPALPASLLAALPLSAASLSDLLLVCRTLRRLVELHDPSTSLADLFASKLSLPSSPPPAQQNTLLPPAPLVPSVSNLLSLPSHYKEACAREAQCTVKSTEGSKAHAEVCQYSAEKMAGNRLLACFATWAGILPAASLESDAPSREAWEAIVVDMLCRFQCNNFCVATDMLAQEGAAVYPLGALLNHACVPTCVLSYERAPSGLQVQTIRALGHLPAGAEVTHAYTDVFAPSVVRRALLRREYFFDCTCRWCVGGKACEALDSMLAGDLRGRLSTASLGSSLAISRKTSWSSIKANDRATLHRMFQQVASLCARAAASDSLLDEQRYLCAAVDLQSKHLHHCHHRLLRTRRQLLNVAMLQADWSVAITQCRALCTAYTKICGSLGTAGEQIDTGNLYPHPLVGVQHATLAALLPLVADNSNGTGGAREDVVDEELEAVKAIARSGLTICNGGDCSALLSLT